MAAPLLITLAAVHVLAWLYVFFAWALPGSAAHVYVVLFLLLPLIYVVQSMPCHLIVYAKLRHIKDNKSQFRKDPGYRLTQVDVQSIDKLAQTLGWDRAELADVWARLKHYEHKLVLPLLVDRARAWFEARSYMNPLSAQGLVLLAFFVNGLALITQYKLRIGRPCSRR